RDHAKSPLFSDAEKVALEYADAITDTRRDVDDELFARVQRHYDDDRPRASTGRSASRRKGSGSAEPTASQRVWTDDFPAVALAEFLALIVVHGAGTMQQLLDVAAGGGRGVEKHDAAGVAARVLPRIRDVAGD